MISNLYRGFWLIWIAIALTMFLIQATTIDVVPSLMQDEAQITDYGRLALDPSSPWSVTWWVAADKPLLLWSYIGPVLAELGYQLGGPDGLGTRIIALFGGVVASTMTLGWLLKRNTPALVSGGLALAFLLDPLFTLSQRMARSDSWVIACCMAACWSLASSRTKSPACKSATIAFAGMLTALAAFIWPSAMLLFPLIIIELFTSLKSTANYPLTLRRQLTLISYFVIAGIFMTIILLLPIRSQLGTILNDMKDMLALNVSSVNGSGNPFTIIFNMHQWGKLLKALGKTLSLGIPALALWSILFKRSWDLLLASLFTLAIIFMTLVYEFRVLYLLPYLLALSASYFQDLRLKAVKSRFQRISTSVLLLVVFSSFAISILLRAAIASGERQGKDRKLINMAANAAIGPGNYNVFLGFTYEFYYTGRALGWSLYTPYIQFSYDAAGNWIRNNDFKPEDQFLKLMSRMDYAIFPKDKLSGELPQQLKASGLRYCATIQLSKSQHTVSEKEYGRANEVLMWFLRGSKGYGPYVIYERPKAARASMHHIGATAKNTNAKINVD